MASRRDRKKTSEPAPSTKRSRTSGAAPAGEGVRNALSVLLNLAALLNKSAPKNAIGAELVSEVDAAVATLRHTFALAQPDLRAFADGRLVALDSARENGPLVREIAADLCAASELHELSLLLIERAPITQTLDAIAQDLAAHWHPVASAGTMRVALTKEARLQTVECDPRVAAHLLGVLLSLVDADGVTISIDGDAFCLGRGAQDGREVARLRLVAPAHVVASAAVATVGGTLEKRGDALYVTLRRA